MPASLVVRGQGVSGPARRLGQHHPGPGRSQAACPRGKPRSVRAGGGDPIPLPVPACRRPLLHGSVRGAADSRSGRAGAGETSPLQITADKFITKSDTLVSVVRVHNPTNEVQTIYVDPTVDLGTPLDYWDVKTSSGLISREGGEVTGREPRSLSLDGRKSLLGQFLAVRFRYAVLDDPPRPLKVAGSSQGRTAHSPGLPSRGSITRRGCTSSLAITSSPARPRSSRRRSRSGPLMNRPRSMPCSSRPAIGPS